MKKITLLLSVLFCLAFFGNANAQLSKKDKKQWKKQMKSMDVEEFKNLVEEKKTLEGEVSRLSSQVNTLQSSASDKAALVDRLQSQVKDLQNQLDETKSQLAASTEVTTLEDGTTTRVAKGVIFKVQIGAFRNKDLSKYFNKNGSFDGEVDDSMQRYTLGTFRDYWEADKFKKYLREMGVKDAWIVAYKDGQRVPLKDVLEGII